MSFWSKLQGTSLGSFIIGFTGPRLKNSGGTLQVRNTGDTTYARADVGKLSVNDAFQVLVQASPSQGADYTLTLPTTDGSPSQVLSTNGSGVLDWVSAASTAPLWTADTTSFAFGSGAVVAAFTLPINAVVTRVDVFVDVAFNGAPSLSVGVNAGSASLFVGAADLLLTVADRYEIHPQVAASGSTSAIELYYSAGGATAGSGRVVVTYAVPA